jgi:hypothetical protein
MTTLDNKDCWRLQHHLLLEKLVAHSVEGNGEPTAEEDDEVECELVAVVDGKGQVVSGRRQPVVIPVLRKWERSSYF